MLVTIRMPFRLSMPISALNGTNPPVRISSQQLSPSQPLMNSLNSPMIGRIFKTPAGCSSCGKR